MNVITGYTVNTIVPSLDSNNNPVSGATFIVEMFQNGVIYTGVTVNYTLVDPIRANFNFYWSSNVTGDFQFYAYNNITTGVYISDIVTVEVTTGIANIYIGL